MQVGETSMEKIVEDYQEDRDRMHRSMNMEANKEDQGVLPTKNRKVKRRNVEESK
jgi:hypothetical protein